MAYQCMKTPSAAHISIMTDSYYADYRPFLSQVRVSTRIFWAKYGLIDRDLAGMMAEATPNCGLVFFEHSGHMLPWTEAEKFNQELAAFAGELLPSP